ncbi:hypothetical protein EcWSU1_01129 [Enterobacter ludwigii]|uniref:Uncharacterized protein n=1 Tax=Enterobacter ludwigii TaxID=299767 RepID=G8LDI1_9ENTR|nr:hypothetical protein EcWSU1_01129 [Enterobacter ludwigii]
MLGEWNDRMAGMRAGCSIPARMFFLSSVHLSSFPLARRFGSLSYPEFF